MKNRIIALVLAMVLVCTMLPVGVSADTGSTGGIVASHVTVTQGGIATVTVSAKDLPTFAAMELFIYYDTQYLTFSSATNGSFLGANASVNTANAGKVSVLAMSLMGFSGSGTMLTLNFKVADSCPAGVLPITLALGNVMDSTFAPLTLNTTNGSITVQEKVVQQTAFSIYPYKDKSSLKKGEEVKFRIANYNSLPVASAQFEFTYDADLFEVVATAPESGYGANKAMWSVNTSMQGKVLFSFLSLTDITAFYMYDITLRAIANVDTTSTITVSSVEAYKSDFTAYLTNTKTATLTLVKTPEVVDHPDLWLDTDTLVVGKQTSSRLMLAEGANVAAANFYVEYDKTVMRPVEVVVSESLTAQGAMLFVDRFIDDGKIDLSYINQTDAASEELELVTIIWEPVTSPSSHYQVTLGGIGVVDRNYNKITLDYITDSDHIYAAQFDWSEDLSACSAQFTCGCGATVTEACGVTVDTTDSTKAVYTATVTVGGSLITDVQEKATLFSIKSANIVLGNELAMNFYVSVSDLEGTDYVAVVTKTYADDRSDLVVEVPYKDWQDMEDGRMRFRFNGIAAKEMGDDIHVVVKKTDGRIASHEYTDSIRGYVERGFYQGKVTGTLLPRLLVDMLNYGAAAQAMFEYDEQNPANGGIAAYQHYATQTASYANIQEKGAGYRSMSLTLASNISATFLFYKTHVTQDMTAVVTFTDHYGRPQRLEIPGHQFDDRTSAWGIIITNLVVADSECPITCTFLDANGQAVEGVYGVDSMESMCTRAIEGGGGDYYAAIVKFCDSARNYLHS